MCESGRQALYVGALTYGLLGTAAVRRKRRLPPWITLHHPSLNCDGRVVQ